MNAGNVDVAMFQLWPQRIRHWLSRELKTMFAFSTERIKFCTMITIIMMMVEWLNRLDVHMMYR